ncbi:MAG TPA: glycosyltransferase family 39 protein [Bacteroidales bacterium]|nr:glycosyltransferase family 39 protein [Bacteroidales bacterium]
MKNKKYRKSLFIVLSSIVIVVFFAFSLNSYLKKTIYSGPVSLELCGLTTDKYTIEATTPRGNHLFFQHTQITYFDSSYRATASLTIKLSDSIHCNESGILIYLNGSNLIKKCPSKNGFIILDKADFNNQSYWKKLYGAAVFIFHKIRILLAILVIIIMIFTVFFFRKKLNQIVHTVSNLVKKNPLLFILNWTIFCVIIVLLIKPPDFRNLVVSKHNPDQIDYQNMAVNFSLGYGINISGRIAEITDYKTFCSDKQAETQNEIKGRRYDRFPAYSVLVGCLYFMVGNNPVMIKFLQLILLTSVVILLILLSRQNWGNTGFYGSLSGAPFLLFYLSDYAEMISPDIITVCINIIIIYFYLRFRKHMTLKYAVLLGVASGISMLFKASLMFFFVFMFADTGMLLFRRTKTKRWKLFMGLYLSFFSVWLPYNIFSIYKSYNKKQSAKEIISKVTSSNCHVNEINSLVSEMETYDSKWAIKDADITRFNDEVLPFLKKNKFVKLTGSGYSKGLEKLILILHYSEYSHIYLMVQLFGTTGLLDINNEFASDGYLSDEWAFNPSSHYSNDGLSGKPDLLRVLNFYYHYPSKILSITSAKLNSYFSKNFILPVFILLAISALLLNLLLQIKQKGYVWKNVFVLFFLITTGLLFIIDNKYLPLLFIMALFALTVTIKYRVYFPAPLIFLYISMVLFPVITFGNPRYLIYYDSFIFVLCGILLIDLIYSVKTLVKVKTNS